ncbi:CoA pyrophosphatase [Nocardioides panacisoli]|uniref:NUDIX hydrolase n=1 Tax=Nocardioides panacisoli TaxID=627624 RepID=UPI001C624FB2|nr:CoA pyrophosphatase [Nocardioides panacisoli]QYJ03703.1 CoA pyrophosphatase [Nocardioides panacisoli]
MTPALGLPDVVPDLPEWLHPVRDGAARIQGSDLTRFLPPEGSDPRRGSVLMLFGEDTDGEGGPDLLLTERAHDMRSHPGQVSFPGGKIDPGESVVAAAVREAEEEIGVAPASVEVFAALPELWLPPSNFAVTPVIGWWRDPHPVTITSPEEVHEIHRVSLAELIDPDHRIQVRHPSGWVGPGFLIGEDKDVILWGFTGGIITRFLDFLGWLPPVPEPPVHELPDYMLAEYPDRSADELDILEEDAE